MKYKHQEAVAQDHTGPKKNQESRSLKSGSSRLVQLKGCCTVYDTRSIDELAGRTTVQLGYIRPASAHAIERTAELALRVYDTLSSPHLQQDPLTTSEDYGTDGIAGAWTPPPHPQGPQNFPGTTGWMEQ